jgi:hypothetical protein
MDDFPIDPPLVVKDSPKPWRLTSLAQARLSAGKHSSRRIAARSAYVDHVDRFGHYLLHFHRDGSYPERARSRLSR